MKNILSGIKTGLFFAGAVIGAGFATGKEVAVFFAGFGLSAYFTMPFLFLTFFFGIKFFLGVSEKVFSGKSGRIFNFLSYITNIILLAGLCAAANKLSGTYYFGAVILLFALLLSKSGYKGAVLCNTVITPIVAIFILVIYIGGFNNLSFETGIGSSDIAILSAINYASFNLWTCCRTITDSNLSKKGKNIAAATGASIITVLLIIMISSLLSGGISLINSEMPGEILAESLHLTKLFYIIILFAIFTSAISFQHCLNKSVSYKPSMQILTFGICVITSYLGFGNIVKLFYPVFGMIGIIFIIYLLILSESDKTILKECYI